VVQLQQGKNVGHKTGGRVLGERRGFGWSGNAGEDLIRYSGLAKREEFAHGLTHAACYLKRVRQRRTQQVVFPK